MLYIVKSGERVINDSAVQSALQTAVNAVIDKARSEQFGKALSYWNYNRGVGRTIRVVASDERHSLTSTVRRLDSERVLQQRCIVHTGEDSAKTQFA